jgi:predicted nucleic acid-binding protein
MLIDSSFYIDSLRRRRMLPILLRDWLVAGRLWTCGIVRVEVLRGVRNETIKADLSLMFDVMTDIPTDDELWRSTAELGWRLDRKGIVLPVSDLVIASCALRAGIPVLTLDPHFSRIPGLDTRRTLS